MTGLGVVLAGLVVATTAVRVGLPAWRRRQIRRAPPAIVVHLQRVDRNANRGAL